MQIYVCSQSLTSHSVPECAGIQNRYHPHIPHYQSTISSLAPSWASRRGIIAAGRSTRDARAPEVKIRATSAAAEDIVRVGA